MKTRKPFPVPVRVSYSCKKCPAYCCTYSDIEVTSRDIERIARHLKLDHPEAQMQFTKYDQKKKVRLLRHRKDTVFESACTMLNQETRRCTVYEARPAICRKFPDSRRCGYYEFLKFEREQQGDPHFIALT